MNQLCSYLNATDLSAHSFDFETHILTVLVEYSIQPVCLQYETNSRYTTD